ncbi:MAG: hypothetical protein O2865_04920 [Planctomycetota bacterium]|nr:hypothetical protein [Planctomycetota bacterium]
MRKLRAFLTLVPGIVLGCSAPLRPDPLAPRAVREVARFEACDHAGSALGRVLLLEIEDPVLPVRRYRVENVAGQWLGYLDANLGVHQRQPFEVDEVFLGVYPMEKGLALLYEVEGPVRLTPVELDRNLPAIELLPRQNR